MPKIYTIGAELGNGPPMLVYSVNMSEDKGPANKLAMYPSKEDAEKAIDLLIDADDNFPVTYTKVVKRIPEKAAAKTTRKAR